MLFRHARICTDEVAPWTCVAASGIVAFAFKRRRFLPAIALAATAAGIAPAMAGNGIPSSSEPPLSATERQVVLSRIEIEGNTAIPVAELDALGETLLGRSVALHEIESLRHRITKLYIERGYINSGAVYRDPAIVEGVLRLRIIEGRISEFEVRGNEDLAASYLVERLYPKDRVLNVNALQERYQQLLADPLFSRASVRLAPGRALGQARLLVDVERAKPWQLSAYFNNHRSVSTGEKVVGLAGLLRNLTGHGDVLDAFAQFSQGSHRSGAGWTLPIAARGPRLSLRYEDGDASVVEAPLDSADVESTVHSFDVGLTQVVVDRLDRRFSLGLTHSERRNTTTVFGQPFSFIAGEKSGISRVRAFRFSQEFVGRSQRSVVALRSTFNYGRTNTERDDPDDALQFPARHFQYWVGQAQYLWRPRAHNWRLEAKAAVQKAQDRLVPLEQFALGGVGTVRGYRENSLVRDNGHALGVSLLWPLDAAGLEHWQLGLFHERGSAWNRNEPKRQLRSVGLGVGYNAHGLDFDLSWAYRIDPRVAAQRSGWQDRGIHVALSYRY